MIISFLLGGPRSFMLHAFVHHPLFYIPLQFSFHSYIHECVGNSALSSGIVPVAICLLIRIACS